MAVSGTVTSQPSRRVDPLRLARFVRRATFVGAALAGTWFFLQFGSRWVPEGMDTVPSIPPGSWCVVDRWSMGLRVGSDVFVRTPAGELLSRVAAIDARGIELEHPNPASVHPDSADFGPIARDSVLATVVVVFPPEVRHDGRPRVR
jgi:hypothetical protein